MERRRRSPARGSSRGRRGAELAGRAAVRALPRAGRRARPASPACRRRGRRRRSPRPRRRRRARSRAPAAIAAAVSAETAPCSASVVRGHAELPALDVVRSTRRRRRGRRRSSRGRTVSRAATSPPVHDSAVASVSPRSRQSVEHELLDRPLVRGEQVPLERLAQRALELVGARLGARLDDEVDVDLEVARADRRLDAVAVAAGLLERARDRRLARRRRSRSTRRPGGRARASSRRTGSVSSARGHSRCSSRGGPGQDDDDAVAACSSTSPGAVPGEAERDGALRQRRLLRRRRPRSRRTAGRSRSAMPARDRLDLRLERLVDDERAARRRARAARPCGRRASGRARPRRRRGRRASPRASAASSSSGAVADDRDPRRLEPERAAASRARNGPFRSLRSPRTSSLPVTTTAARGRRQAPLEAVTAGRVTTHADAVASAGGSCRRVPVHRRREVRRGRSTSIQSASRTKRCVCPVSSVPAKSCLPDGEREPELARTSRLRRASRSSVAGATVRLRRVALLLRLRQRLRRGAGGCSTLGCRRTSRPRSRAP